MRKSGGEEVGQGEGGGVGRKGCIKGGDGASKVHYTKWVY